MTNPVRPPGANVFGDGRLVILTGPAASFVDELLRAAPLDLVERLTARHRAHRAVIESERVGLGVVAEMWRQSCTRRDQAALRDIRPLSEQIGTGTAAGLLGVDVRTIQRMIHDGRLLARREGGRWLMDRQQVDDYRAGRTAA